MYDEKLTVTLRMREDGHLSRLVLYLILRSTISRHHHMLETSKFTFKTLMIPLMFCSFFSFFNFPDKYCISGQCFSSFLIYCLCLFLYLILICILMYLMLYQSINVSYCSCTFTKLWAFNSKVSVCLWWLSYSSK